MTMSRGQRHLLQHHHAEWQPGQAWIAAAGGADRTSAKNPAAPMNQSREAHYPAGPLHSPEGHALQVSEPASRRGDEGAGGARGLPQSKHGQRLKALTCTFAPPAGLGPAPYGLEVGSRPSTVSWRVPFSLLRSGPRSRWCTPVALGRSWRNDRRNDRRASPPGFSKASSPRIQDARTCPRTLQRRDPGTASETRR
jgi:hypothetical protein